MTISLSRFQFASVDQPAPGLNTHQAILRALIYSDMFDYAPSINELARFLEVPDISSRQLEQALQEIQAAGTIALRGGRVMLAGREELAAISLRRQDHSAQKWQAARRYTALIRCLPFVRMVAVTGTLAAHNAEAADDIDLFLITAPGRVWLTRALTILVVRLAALLRITLCPNYLIASDALELSGQNLYSARELIQMQPLYGSLWYHRLRACNRWTLDYLPNAQMSAFPISLPLDRLPAPARLLKLLGEWLLGGRLGTALEHWEMRRKVRKLLHQRAPAAPEEASFSSTTCKGHFEGHAARILHCFHERIASFSMAEER